jgi:hypothetical protein
MKFMISLGIIIGGTIGGWIGALMTHNNWFSFTSIVLGGVGSIVGIVLGGVGSIVGIVLGFKIGKRYF